YLVLAVGVALHFLFRFFFSSRRRHTRFSRDWSSDVCSSDLGFNASATKINQQADDAASIITGISDWTYNWTGYYENDLFQVRLRSEERRVGKECRSRW